MNHLLEKLMVVAMIFFVASLAYAIIVISTPKSQGVVFTDGSTAVIEQGGQLVLIDSLITARAWTISEVGDSVKMTCRGACHTKYAKLCGVGCAIHPNLGPGTKPVQIIQLSNGGLLVGWSWPTLDH